MTTPNVPIPPPPTPPIHDVPGYLSVAAAFARAAEIAMMGEREDRPRLLYVAINNEVKQT